MSAPTEVRDCTDDFVVDDAQPASHGKPAGKEADPHRIAQRQKQVDLGKNTLGYQRYRQQVPRNRRRPRQDPITPDIYQVCSKRSFDGQIKKWRRMLHEWDPSDETEQENLEAASGPSSNPLAPESSERSYEHITHEECQEAPEASPGPGSGRSLRPAYAGQAQRATLTALRKRNFSESAMTCRSCSPSGAYQVPLPVKLAKTQQTPAQPSRAAMAMQPSAGAAAAAAAPRGEAPEEREVDFGEDEDWAYIEMEEAAGGTTVYNNWAALEGDNSGLDDVTV